MENGDSNYENAHSQISNNDEYLINNNYNNNEKNSNKSNGYNDYQNMKNNYNNEITNLRKENNIYLKNENEINNKNDLDLKDNGLNQKQIEPIFETDNNKETYCSKCSCFIF